MKVRNKRWCSIWNRIGTLGVLLLALPAVIIIVLRHPPASDPGIVKMPYTVAR